MKYLFIFIFLVVSLDSFSGTTVIPDKSADGVALVKLSPFAAKDNYLFRGHGFSCNIGSLSTQSCEFTITYAHAKFNGIQIFNGSNGDHANLKVLDTATGGYSGTPNAVLNQFGYNWFMGGETKVVLPYVSDLYTGMRIVLEVTNTLSISKTIYVNLYLHEETN